MNFYERSKTLHEGPSDPSALLQLYDRGERGEQFLLDLYKVLERSRHPRLYEIVETDILSRALEALADGEERHPFLLPAAAYVWQSDTRARRFHLQMRVRTRDLVEFAAFIGKNLSSIEGPQWDSGLFKVLKKNLEALEGADIEVLPAKGHPKRLTERLRSFWSARLRVTPHYPYAPGDSLYREDEEAGWPSLVETLKADIVLTPDFDFDLGFYLAAPNTRSWHAALQSLLFPLRDGLLLWPTRETLQRLIPEAAQRLIAAQEASSQFLIEAAVRFLRWNEVAIRQAGRQQQETP